MRARRRVGALQSREHARMRGSGTRRLLERGEIGLERARAVEILHQPPLPNRRQVQSGNQRGEEAHVAHADHGCRAAVVPDGFEREHHAFGVGRFAVLPPERFDAGLQIFAGAAALIAEHGAEIAIARGQGLPLARWARQTGIVRSGRRQSSSPAEFSVRNRRRRNSSPDSSKNTSAGCSTGGSTRAYPARS